MRGARCRVPAPLSPQIANSHFFALFIGQRTAAAAGQGAAGPGGAGGAGRAAGNRDAHDDPKRRRLAR